MITNLISQNIHIYPKILGESSENMLTGRLINSLQAANQLTTGTNYLMTQTENSCKSFQDVQIARS